MNTTSLSLRFLFTVVVARIFATAIFRLTFQNIVRYFHEMSLKISFQGETFRLKLREISLESSGEQRTKFVEFRLHYFCTILYSSRDFIPIDSFVNTSGHFNNSLIKWRQQV